MRRLLPLVVTLVLFAVLAPSARASEVVEADGDWITVLLRAETDVRGLQLDVSSDVRYPGRPGPIGAGIRDGEHGAIAAFDFTDDVTVSVAGLPGGYLEVFVEGQDQPSSMSSSGTLFGGDELTAGDEIEMLLFFPGGTASHIVRTESSSGTLLVDVRSGVGSQAFSVVSTTTTGTGVSTYAATAGDVTVRRGPKSAIIGGLASCTACIVDVTHDASTMSSSPGSSLPLLAGTAGEWAFHWQGLDVDEGGADMLAAYAPVGDEIMRRWRAVQSA